MQNKDNFLEKAAQQVLSEVLGYDEAKAYYLILTKKETELEKEFSYSKKYRMLKNLFNLGAMGKIKLGQKDTFVYVPMPPSFLYEKDVETNIINFLEEIYLKNHSKILTSNFSQLAIKEEKTLLIFLLKYFMKDFAKIVADKINLKEILGKNSDKVTVINSKEEAGRKIGVIDGNIAFEFIRIKGIRTQDYLGYIAHQNGDEYKNEFVNSLSKELNGF